jgi:hypothetical protein
MSSWARGRHWFFLLSSAGTSVCSLRMKRQVFSRKREGNRSCSLFWRVVGSFSPDWGNLESWSSIIYVFRNRSWSCILGHALCWWLCSGPVWALRSHKAFFGAFWVNHTSRPELRCGLRSGFWVVQMPTKVQGKSRFFRAHNLHFKRYGRLSWCDH